MCSTSSLDLTVLTFVSHDPRWGRDNFLHLPYFADVPRSPKLDLTGVIGSREVFL
jgi:hypothetical protein